MPMAVSTPARGVRAPASKLTTERAKPPVTGYPALKAEATLAAPRPISSRLGWMRSRRFRGERLGDGDGFHESDDRDQDGGHAQISPEVHIQRWH